MGQVSKLNYVDGKLGANTGGQQTTRIIYNTVNNNTSSGVIQYDFFKSFQNLTPGQTNLTTNKLDSSESMVVKTISLLAINFGGGPYARVDNSIFQAGGLLTVTIGNQDVVTKLPIQYNATGQAYDRLHANAGGDFAASIVPGSPGQFDEILEIRLLTDIVIPPQVSFSVRVETYQNNAVGLGTITCILSGYGKIFSAGSSF